MRIPTGPLGLVPPAGGAGAGGHGRPTAEWVLAWGIRHAPTPERRTAAALALADLILDADDQSASSSEPLTPESAMRLVAHTQPTEEEH